MKDRTHEDVSYFSLPVEPAFSPGDDNGTNNNSTNTILLHPPSGSRLEIGVWGRHELMTVPSRM